MNITNFIPHLTLREICQHLVVVVAPTLAKVLAALAAFIIIAFAMPAKYAESLHKYAKARCLKVALTTIPYTYVRRSLIKKKTIYAVLRRPSMTVAPATRLTSFIRELKQRRF